MIWTIILAAGESKRMGEPKMLLPFGGKTIIEAVAESVVSSEANGFLIVLGAEREKIKEKIKDYGIRSVFNPDFQSGMLSSVKCGFKAVPEGTRAVLVVLGDQPRISSGIINQLIEAYKKTGKGIVLPVFERERGHPVIIDMKYKEEVENLRPDIGLRGTVYSHPEDILEVEVDTPAVIQDIDYESDYERELKNEEPESKKD
ncbi:MAG: nucleotidyltransferase family protein [Candidatus Aminicenantes bacterium]|nr:nucleotidyltransferase family protein [Candidatus Aminicenantes bacterium]MDH5705305.1 nucleotidyltransferase family protein [Candidatus Aminicenantes bacterium]